METEQKVFSYMEEHHMVTPGDRIAVGVSGGADSVCLLFLLVEYGKRVPLSLQVVHVNHGIREDAAEDAAYVESLCARLQIPFQLVEADIPALARSMGCSEEEAGRHFRYESFAKAAPKIAVAHNRNDSAETLLFHLFRGTGLKGLGGIRPVRGQILRPLLCLERAEIEEYLNDRGITWRNDSTNDQDAYARNRIRHHILPFAEEEIAHGATEHIARTAELMAGAADYMEAQADRALRQCESQEGDRIVLAVEPVNAQPKILQSFMLYRTVLRVSPGGRDIGMAHVQALTDLFCREGNRAIDLPFGIRAMRQYDKVYLWREAPGTDTDSLRRMENGSREIPLPALGEVCQIALGRGEYLELRVLDVREVGQIFRKNKEVSSNLCTEWLDCDKIGGNLVLRTRQKGDFFTILNREGNLRHKSLQDYAVDQKIPRQMRDDLWLLADGQHVVWLIGYRISEFYKISENTKQVLQVQLKKDCESSETEEKDG